jgi:hypothetical protein
MSSPLSSLAVLGRAEGFGGVEAGGADGGRDAGEQADGEGDAGAGGEGGHGDVDEPALGVGVKRR